MNSPKDTAAEAEMRARARFVLLSLIRFSGAIIALAGAVVVGRRLIEPAEIIGGLMLALGAFEVILLPAILVRNWKRQP
ncbi:hypothetical protein FHS96_004354 [Sphingomonas zeicaulis]|uniref:hypothetical protein n=1 Tax=Sphingomonas zeicaulis TaxID=1632740 RepID=UPI003D229E01